MFTPSIFIDYNKFVFKLFNINRFHLWNDTIGICEFKQERLTNWIENNKTDDIVYISKHCVFNF